MTEKSSEIHILMTLRRTLIILGVVLTILALFGDRIGQARTYSGLGTIQIALALIGLVFVTVGILGRRVVSLYKTTAILLLNTALFILCLELGLSVSNAASTRLGLSGSQPVRYIDSSSRRSTLPYYAAQAWSQQYWSEYELTQRNYYPYGVWRTEPFDGETINVDSRGIRLTPDTDCGDDSFTIFVLGGSTMWGVGAPDWGTIPAYLQASLESIHADSICIVNLADLQYTSSQEVVVLTTELQLGHTPDVVIFYDGVNDTGATLQNREQPWIHGNYHTTISRLQATRSNPLLDWLQSFQLYRTATHLVPQLAQRQPVIAALPDLNYENAADGIVQVYLNNYRIVDALSRAYNFDYYFFLQPYINSGNKPLTLDEMAMRTELTSEEGELLTTVYQQLAEASASHEHLHSLEDVLDGQEEQIYIDLVHITPIGNQIIANAISSLLPT